MGYEDRDYYRDAAPGFGGASFSKKSMIMVLIIINVVVFSVDLFTHEVNDFKTQWLSKTLAIKTDQLWQFWTFLTYGFSHASYGTDIGIFHILGNMITLFFLGPTVEDRLGRRGFLWFYLFAIVVGGLTWLPFALAQASSGSVPFLVGASGAVSAVIAYFVFKDPFAEILAFGVFRVPAWAVGIFFLITNLSYAFGGNSGIAWQAHLGGAVFGWASFHFAWTFRSLDGFTDTVGKLFARGPKLKVHDPGTADEKLKQEADRILAKISEQGESSLTRKESRTLKRYSNQLRKNRPGS